MGNRLKQPGNKNERWTDKETKQVTTVLLVLYLVVEVPSEPVIKPAFLNVTCARQLHGDPIFPLVCVNVHGQVTDLSAPHKPMALQEPDKEVPAEAGPETSQ